MMLVTWMAYASLVAAGIAVGAFGLERIAAIWGGARRFVWLGALSLALIVPLVLAVRPVARATRYASVELGAVQEIASDVVAKGPLITASKRAATMSPDRAALDLWA